MSNADIPADDRGNDDYDKYDDLMKKIMLMMISCGATFPCSSCGRDVGLGDLPSYHPIKCTTS